MRELVPRLLDAGARWRSDAGIGFTIDAEEAERLELSLDLIEAVSRRPSLAGWDGLRASRSRPIRSARSPLIDWLADLARAARAGG